MIQSREKFGNALSSLKVIVTIIIGNLLSDFQTFARGKKKNHIMDDNHESTNLLGLQNYCNDDLKPSTIQNDSSESQMIRVVDSLSDEEKVEVQNIIFLKNIIDSMKMLSINTEKSSISNSFLCMDRFIFLN